MSWFTRVVIDWFNRFAHGNHKWNDQTATWNDPNVAWNARPSADDWYTRNPPAWYE